jgi:hypothetical protein
MKPMSAWVPSQTGLDADCPQRHSAIWGMVGMSTQPAAQTRAVGDEIGAGGLGVDGARQRRLHVREQGPALGRVVGSEGDGQVLEPGDGLEDLEGQVDVVLDPQPGGPTGHVQRSVGRGRIGICLPAASRPGVSGRSRRPSQLCQGLVEGADDRPA